MDTLLAVLRAARTAPRFQDWATMPAVEYRGKFNAESLGTTGDAHLLSDYGFTLTGLTAANGSGADLPPANFGTPGATIDAGLPGSITLADAVDVFLSPPLFGHPDGFRQAAKLLGQAKPPGKLRVEFQMAFTTGSNNETASGAGLIEDGGSPVTAADHFAFIYSDGTNIRLRSGAADETVIAALAVVTTPLYYAIELSRISQLITWFSSVDGFTWTKRGTLAVEADELPVAFGAGVVSAGANDVVLYGDVYLGYE